MYDAVEGARNWCLFGVMSVASRQGGRPASMGPGQIFVSGQPVSQAPTSNIDVRTLER